jgi:tagatose-1,6-bisphosphate aldolase non-catalytic subunit AgaZ/GatZ
MKKNNEVTFREVIDTTLMLFKKGDRFSHLGINPMSEEIILASIELAMEHGFPLLYVVSRNQVSEDEGGGYVMGLNQEEFVGMIQDMEELSREKIRPTKPYLRFISVDHCGPWYKEHEKGLEMEEALDSVKRTITACIHAGYAGIHIDCSFPPPKQIIVDDKKQIELTVELFSFSEEERKRLRKPELLYEIGTEETVGEATTPDHFKKSIELILKELNRSRLPLPSFIVGKTGAKIQMLENRGNYDYTSASSLPEIASGFNMAFKEHNADYLSDMILSLHPEYGITGANIGPSLAAAQTRALLDLADIEKDNVGKNKSDLYRIMSEAVLEKSPYAKWLKPDDRWTAKMLRNMPSELRAVTLVAGHYVYYEESVKDAIDRMYNNLKHRGIYKNPSEYVLSRIKMAIMRYVSAFKLSGSTIKILEMSA